MAIKYSETLEAILNNRGMTHVLLGLQEICKEKAEHISAKWRDEQTASAWASMSKVLGEAAEKAKEFPLHI